MRLFVLLALVIYVDAHGKLWLPKIIVIPSKKPVFGKTIHGYGGKGPAGFMDTSIHTIDGEPAIAGLKVGPGYYDPDYAQRFKGFSTGVGYELSKGSIGEIGGKGGYLGNEYIGYSMGDGYKLPKGSIGYKGEIGGKGGYLGNEYIGYSIGDGYKLSTGSIGYTGEGGYLGKGHGGYYTMGDGYGLSKGLKGYTGQFKGKTGYTHGYQVPIWYKGAGKGYGTSAYYSKSGKKHSYIINRYFKVPPFYYKPGGIPMKRFYR